MIELEIYFIDSMYGDFSFQMVFKCQEYFFSLLVHTVLVGKEKPEYVFTCYLSRLMKEKKAETALQPKRKL